MPNSANIRPKRQTPLTTPAMQIAGVCHFKQKLSPGPAEDFLSRHAKLTTMNNEITLIAEHSATIIAPKAWTSTTWTIRSNRKVIINIRYNQNDTKERDVETTISQDVYDEIFDTLELAKRDDRKIFVLDAAEWSFKQYQNGNQCYRRNSAAIDGVRETFALLVEDHRQSCARIPDFEAVLRGDAR